MRLVFAGMMFLVGVALFSAGSSEVEPDRSRGETPCPEVRPEICTMEYDPVCGVGLLMNPTTFPSGCVACADHKVSAYIKGRCHRGR